MKNIIVNFGIVIYCIVLIYVYYLAGDNKLFLFSNLFTFAYAGIIIVLQLIYDGDEE